MKAYEVIIDELIEEDIDTVFTLMSSGTMRLLSNAYEDGATDVDIIRTRHEQAAVAMADGYFRSSGNLSACIIGQGPAIAQTGTSLVTTFKNGSRILIIVPVSSSETGYDHKRFKQRSYLESTVENVLTVRREADLIDDLREAIWRIQAENHPVVVQIPKHILNGEVSGDEDGTRKRSKVEPPSGTLHPDPSKVEEVIDLYLDSDATKAPVFLVGRGAVKSDAKEGIDRLAERMNALIVTTVKARGHFDDHPFAIGFVGDYGANMANEYLMESDFVLAIGCSLNSRTTDQGYLFQNDQKIVQIDTNSASIGRYQPVDLGVVGDAGVTVDALDKALADIGFERDGVFWTEKLKRRISEYSPLEEGVFSDRSDAIDPRELVKRLDELLPADRIVVSDVGHHARWVLDGITTQSPDDFIWPSEFGSIGQGLACGIGASVGDRGRTCVAFCGDGGIMMAIQELDTASRNEIPLIVVVFNDSAYGTEYHSLDRYGEDPTVGVFKRVEIADIATAMDVEGHVIESVNDLGGIQGKISQPPDTPILLDCRVDLGAIHRSKI